MYLSLLNKKEKELFLGLAYGVSLIDGKYTIEEKQIIESYCDEMQISSSVLNKQVPLNDIIDEMVEECSSRNKKVIVFEIIGLAMCDGKYDGKEKDFIFELSQKFRLDQDFSTQCANIISEYILFQSKINALVIG